MPTRYCVVLDPGTGAVDVVGYDGRRWFHRGSTVYWLDWALARQFRRGFPALDELAANPPLSRVRVRGPFEARSRSEAARALDGEADRGRRRKRPQNPTQRLWRGGGPYRDLAETSWDEATAGAMVADGPDVDRDDSPGDASATLSVESLLDAWRTSAWEHPLSRELQLGARRAFGVGRLPDDAVAPRTRAAMEVVRALAEETLAFLSRDETRELVVFRWFPGPATGEALDLLPLSSWSDSPTLARSRPGGFVAGARVSASRVVLLPGIARDREVVILGGRLDADWVERTPGEPEAYPVGAPERGAWDWLATSPARASSR